VVRALLGADQQRLHAPWSKDVLRLVAYDRCNAQLEFFDGFDWALFFHFLNLDLKVFTERSAMAN
jgi:hypothetical protein